MIDETTAVGTLLAVRDFVLYLRNLDTLLSESLASAVHSHNQPRIVSEAL